VSLSGTNTYTGGTTIEGVWVGINNDAHLGDSAGTLAITNGRLGNQSDVTMNRATTLTGFAEFFVNIGTLTTNGVIDGNGELRKQGSGTIVLGNAANTFAGDLVIERGTVSVGSEGAMGAGNIRFDVLGGTLELTGPVDTAKTVALNANGTIATEVGDSTFSGEISGTGSLAKVGLEQLTLSGPNTYEGGTFLGEGALRIADDSSIGTGTLTTEGGTTLVAGIGLSQTIVLANEVVLNAGITTIDFVGTNGILNATTGAYITNGTNLTLDGGVSGTGGIISQNFGILNLNGANSYEGGTELTGVAALVGADGALGTGLVTLNDFASVQSTAVAGVTLANEFQINATPGFGAALGGNADLTLTGDVNGGGVLDKAGTGTLTVTSATSGFDGALNVNDGRFIVADGAVFGGAALETVVRNGATLGGSGTITGNVNMANASILAPGESPGTLTIAGNLTLSSATNVNYELGQAYTPGGALNDLTIVTGNLTLDGLLTVSESVGGAFTLGVYNLFQYGTLTDNGLTIQTLPGAFTGFVQNNAAASQINLIVAAPGTFIQYWDGADEIGNGTIDGGNGSWTTSSTNWTGSPIDPLAFPNPGGPPSDLNTNWQPNSVGVFQGTAGAVSVDNDFAFQGLQFLTDGYELTAGGGSLTIGSPQSFIYTEAGVSTVVSALVTGAGQLLKQGAGKLVLNEANDYAGGTLLQMGTIGVTDNLSLGTGTLTMLDNTTLQAFATPITLANTIVTNGAGTVDSDLGDLTLTGVISGAGSIIKTGEGTLVLQGNNSYAGGTDLTDGTIEVGTSTAIGTGTLTVSDSGTTLRAGADNLVLENAVQLDQLLDVDTQPFTFTLNGDIAGGGAIRKGSLGNLILNGDNSYNGLGIDQGTVTLGTNTAAGIGNIQMFGTAEIADVTLAAGVDGLTIANPIGITGLFNYIDTNGFTFSLDGVISDLFGNPGKLIKEDAGTLVLNGANTYTLGTDLLEGTIVTGTNSALGTGVLTMSDLTTLSAGEGTTVNNDIVTLATGLIASNGTTYTLNGNISGAGSISHVTMGNLVLNGDNSFTNLGINAGTVTLGTNTAAGIGGIAIADNATLAAGVDDLEIANDIQTLGNGIVVTDGFTFTLNGQIGGTDITIANDVETLANGLIATNGNTFTINGDISGDGSISSVSVGGNLVLNGDNSFTNLGINNGTVTLGTDTAAGIGSIAIADGTTLAANTDIAIANDVETLGNGLIATNGNEFTINGDISGDGSISSVSVGGNLILNGDNSFTNLGINNGIVTLGTDTAAGIGSIAIADGTTLAAGTDITIANDVETLANGLIATNGNTFTINGDISGDGSISSVSVGGNLVLNGDNSFTNLGINNGTVTLGTDTAAGIGSIAIADGTTLAANTNIAIANDVETLGGGLIATNGNEFTINGDISGAGSISSVSVGGNLVLNGDNSFTNLGINNGTVTLGTDTAAGIGDIAIASNTTLAANTNVTIANGVQTLGNGLITTTGNGLVSTNGGIFTLNGNISGPGSISNVGLGNLILNGNNSYTNLGINNGIVTLGTNTAGGIGDIAINSGATLAAGVSGLVLANQVVTTGTGSVNSGAGVLTLSGPIIGAGGLTKIGTGQLAITGTANTYTGATTVAAGDLRVMGSIASSAVTVQSGARISGTGTVGGLVVQSGGTAAPGTSVGTLNVAGPVTFLAGSTYAAEVNPLAADRITATGPASLNGTLAVAAQGGPFTTFNTSYTLLSGSSVTGTFSTVTGLSAFGVAFNPMVSYGANTVTLRLAPASLVGLAGAGTGPNGLQVAAAFDRAVAGGYNPQAYFNLYTQGANIGTALSQLSGEVHAAERRVAMEDTRVIRETAFDRLNAGLATSGVNTQTASSNQNGAETTMWLRGVGSWGTAKADGVGSRFTTEQIGVLTGLDYAKDGFKIGAAFTFTQNDIEMASLGNARVRSTGGAVYAGYRSAGGFSIGAGGSIAGTRATSNRAITAPGLAQTLRGEGNGTTYQLFGELAYDIVAGEKAQVTPFARYAYVNHRANAFGETGGFATVSGARQSTDISVITAGLRAGFELGGSATLVGSAAYQNITGDRAGNAALVLSGPNQLMNIRAVELDKDSAAVEAKVNFRVGGSAVLGVGYSGVIGSKNSDHGARATLSVGF